MKKGHKQNTVGPWAASKLKALEEYLFFYCTALSKQAFKRVYIDAFAGSCVSKIRSTPTQYDTDQFFGDREDAEAQEQFLLGSPHRALGAPFGFDEHYFFDLDESRAATLNELKSQYPNKRMIVEVGDCNPRIQQLIGKLASRSIRGVAFLDPYGPHLEWETVAALARAKNFEVIINFPAAMAINRLITRSGIIPENWNVMLDKCFGGADWKAIAYSTSTDLFGQTVTSKNVGVAERLLELYVSNLKDLFPCVARPRLILNTRKTPLYYLLWAGPHKLGLKGANYVLSIGKQLPARKR